MLTKPEAAIQLIKEALEAGILAGTAEIRELSWSFQHLWLITYNNQEWNFYKNCFCTKSK